MDPLLRLVREASKRQSGWHRWCSHFDVGHYEPLGEPGLALDRGQVAVNVHTLIAGGHVDSLQPVAARAGHATGSITLDRYGHLMPASEEAARMLDAYLEAGREAAEERARAAAPASAG